MYICDTFTLISCHANRTDNYIYKSLSNYNSILYVQRRRAQGRRAHVDRA